MLNFDSNHKQFSGKITQNVGKKVKNMIVSGLIISSILMFGGCCEIEGTHMHEYTSDNGASFYFPGESDKIGTYMSNEEWAVFQKTDNYIPATDQEKHIYFTHQRETGSTLLEIDKNIDFINKQLSEIKESEWLEYRYLYTINAFTGRSIANKLFYGWTRDPEDTNLTGEVRAGKYVYYGYNIEKDDEGNYELVQSEPYSSFEELQNSDYTYIDSHITSTVYSDTYMMDDNNDLSQSENDNTKVR